MNNYGPLLMLEQLPIQQNRVFRSQESAINCLKGDITLVQDINSGVVYNSSFKPDLMVYDEDYQNEQGYSESFQRHLSVVAGIVEKYQGNGKVVEVGCGKGKFLECLRSRGCEVVGVDPAYEGNADYVIKASFSIGMGLSGSLVVLRHVLEHISDPFSFLDSIAEANGRNGLIYIEVPCLDWINANKAWFDIFYEHVNYFRISNFDRFFGRIIDSGKLFGGQYLYIVADLSSIRKCEGNVDEIFSFGQEFMSGIDQVLDVIGKNKGKHVVIWGGGSKGVILAQHVNNSVKHILSFSIDINPAKQGGFFPGSGLLVVSPEDGLQRMSDGDIILIMNSNYADEIIDFAGRRFLYWSADSGVFL